MAVHNFLHLFSVGKGAADKKERRYLADVAGKIIVQVGCEGLAQGETEDKEGGHKGSDQAPRDPERELPADAQGHGQALSI